MSKHKYNEAWKKGFDSGVEAQKQSCVFDCVKDFDEYETGYKKGRADAIEEFCSEIDLEEPMHFTKEQVRWIKKYVILKRQNAIDELLNNISESIIWDILAEVMKRNIVASEGADKVIDYLQKVAKQLKEQEDD